MFNEEDDDDDNEGEEEEGKYSLPCFPSRALLLTLLPLSPKLPSAQGRSWRIS